MGVSTKMPTREENRQPNEVALFRSLDPWYGYGTKPDFDAYFANHGYAYGSNFGAHNTPSLPYPNYETKDVPFGTYHRGCYSLGYSSANTYGPYGPHHGAVVGPESYSQSVGAYYAGHPGFGPAPLASTGPYVLSHGPYGHPHAAYAGYHGYHTGPGYFTTPAPAKK